MSRFEDGSYGSLSGVALIAKVLAGRCRMKYTRAAIGKGVIPDDMTPKTMTGCSDYVMDAIIAEVSNPVDGECQVTIQVKSDNVEKGFYATNIVLFAEDPDEGEVAYTYLSLENEPEWIRPASSIVGKLATFDIIAAVGDVDVVEAVIDPDALVTRREWEQLATQLASRRMDLTIPADGWVQDGEGKYPFRRDIPVDGTTADMIPQLTVLEAGEAAAIACGLAPRVETLDGAVRVSAASIPSAPIPASLTLQGDSSGLILSGGGESGVKVKPGSGLIMDSDRNLALNAATGKEVARLFTGSNG